MHKMLCEKKLIATAPGENLLNLATVKFSFAYKICTYLTHTKTVQHIVALLLKFKKFLTVLRTLKIIPIVAFPLVSMSTLN